MATPRATAYRSVDLVVIGWNAVPGLPTPSEVGLLSLEGYWDQNGGDFS